MSEYRQDDRTIGYCPKCGATLATVYTDAAGWCPQHGRVWAEWTPPPITNRDPGDETTRPAKA